jgi:hypothetical protein
VPRTCGHDAGSRALSCRRRNSHGRRVCASQVFSRRHARGRVGHAGACLPVRAEEGVTPMAAGVRYRKIGTSDQARLAAILDKELDAFMGGSTMRAAELKGRFATPQFFDSFVKPAAHAQ